MAKEIIASLAQLAEHTLRKRTVMGSIPIGGLLCRAHFRFLGLKTIDLGDKAAQNLPGP